VSPLSPLVEVRELHAGYGRTVVVRDLSLTVDPGEVVALLGPNGAGKTTTLMTAAGLLPALAGEVLLFGEQVDTGSPHRNERRGLGYVTEDRSLFGGLTVHENLRLAGGGRRGRAQRGGGDGRRRPGVDLADVTRYFPALGPLAHRRTGLLSGGEQQMLAVARALMSNPRVLLLDEPTTGLAPKLAADAYAALAALREQGLTIIVAEQQVPLVLGLADRGYVLESGRIQLDGAAAELERNPDVQRAYLGVA